MTGSKQTYFLIRSSSIWRGKQANNLRSLTCDKACENCNTVETIGQRDEILKFWIRVLQLESDLSSFASTNNSTRLVILAQSKHKGEFNRDQTVADAQSITEKLGRNQIRG